MIVGVINNLGLIFYFSLALALLISTYQKILVSNRLPYQCISAFENNNILLIPRVGSQRINIGNFEKPQSVEFMKSINKNISDYFEIAFTLDDKREIFLLAVFL